jgi:hypothetical protein
MQTANDESTDIVKVESGNEFRQAVAEIQGTSLMASDAMKGVAEVQAAVVMAKKFPRDQFTAFNKIQTACERKGLAESAVYAYPRGGQTVSGPSIRLAESMAQLWGNLDYGIRELSRTADKSVAEAYAWDLETNVRSTRIFEIPHERHTRSGSYKLTDPRDIYENVANQGSRRVRACILQIIPGDVTEAAVAKCKKTVTSGTEPIVDRIRKMLAGFEKQGVKQAHVEKRLGHAIDITTSDELFELVTVFNAIKDGGKRSDFFEIADTEPTAKTEALKDKVKCKEPVQA